MASKDVYQSMQEALVGFRSGILPLSDLTGQLPELLTALDDTGEIDRNWREQYVSCWWTLEQIHGEAIDLGESRRMPRGSRDTVDDAVSELEQLVSGALTS